MSSSPPDVPTVRGGPEDILTLDDRLAALRREFAFPEARVRTMIAAFHDEMARGLRGDPSSLKMLPAFIDVPTGRESGTFLALDLGGTNFRVLRVELPGGGGEPLIASERFRLETEHISLHADALFGAVARFIRHFLESHVGSGAYPMGFTFSFPIRQERIDRGELIHWNKGWSVDGVVGRDVVELLNKAMAREGLAGVRVVSLDNDTTGTLMARAYRDPACDVGCIIGTGTNACYREALERIAKPIGPYGRTHMLINMESGAFDKALPRTAYDARLDAESENPGGQWEEKMVSGKYLGEVARLVVAAMCERDGLFRGDLPALFAARESFGTELVSEVEADVSGDAEGVLDLLARSGAAHARPEDAAALRQVCRLVSERSARIAAAVLAAVVTWVDPEVERPHTIAVDGSLYEKHPDYAEEMHRTFDELFGGRAGRVRTELTTDGSGLGAAVIAAVASSGASSGASPAVSPPRSRRRRG